MDGLDGYLNATGGFRTGIVACPLAGELVAEAWSGEDSSLPLETYRVERFESSAAAAESA